MKFEDVNGDGKINADDRVRLDKTTHPTFNFGATFELRYKGFDLSIFPGCNRSLYPYPNRIRRYRQLPEIFLR